MLKFIARVWARLAYVFKLEVEARNHELHAKLAGLQAQQKREQAEKLNKDADAIEANIKQVAERLEVGYWECPNGHEKRDAFIPESMDDTARRCLDCKEPAKFLKRSQMTPQEQYEADKGRKEAENHRAPFLSLRDN